MVRCASLLLLVTIAGATFGAALPPPQERITIRNNHHHRESSLSARGNRSLLAQGINPPQTVSSVGLQRNRAASHASQRQFRCCTSREIKRYSYGK